MLNDLLNQIFLLENPFKCIQSHRPCENPLLVLLIHLEHHARTVICLLNRSIVRSHRQSSLSQGFPNLVNLQDTFTSDSTLNINPDPLSTHVLFADLANSLSQKPQRSLRARWRGQTAFIRD